MNERIQKFAEQATSSRNQYNPHTMLTERVEEFDKEKFAELIIKDAAECIANDVRMSMVTAESVAFDMKMRYGVE